MGEYFCTDLVIALKLILYYRQARRGLNCFCLGP